MGFEVKTVRAIDAHEVGVPPEHKARYSFFSPFPMPVSCTSPSSVIIMRSITTAFGLSLPTPSSSPTPAAVFEVANPGIAALRNEIGVGGIHCPPLAPGTGVAGGLGSAEWWMGQKASEGDAGEGCRWRGGVEGGEVAGGIVDRMIWGR